MAKILLALTVLLLCVGCAHTYKNVPRHEVERAFKANSSATFLGYYYEGSDGTHHYFRAKWKFARDDYFKVPLMGLTVLKTRSRDKAAIRMSPHFRAEDAHLLFAIGDLQMFVWPEKR